MASQVTIKAVGDWDAQMSVPIGNAIAATVELTGRSGREACKMAMVYMARSARVDTPISKKLRPIVRNPSDRWKTDRRVAPWGVMRWSEGKQTFRPIFRTGEFGKIRFYHLNAMSWFERDAANPKGKWKKIGSFQDVANPDIIVPGIKTDRRRKIANRGLARRSWMWGLRLFGEDPGDPSYKGAKPDVSMFEMLETNSCGFVLWNNLRYIKKITPPNLEQDVANRASNQIMAQAARRMERDYGIEIPRLAAQRARRAERTLSQAWRAAP